MKCCRKAFWYCQEVVAFLLCAALVPLVLREVFNRRKVTVVNYHDPSPERLKQHLRRFSRCYNVISMGELDQCLSSGHFGVLPPKAMVITFDDGHRGNAMLASLLRQYRVPAVIYVVSGVVNTQRKFWWQLGLRSEQLRRLKHMLDDERVQWLEKNCGYKPNREYHDRCALSDGELKILSDRGAVIGGHSLSHPNLTKCSDAVLHREVCECKRDLEERTGHKVESFAYPGGFWDERVRDEVVRAGYSDARTIDFGWVTPDSDRFALPCIGISDAAGVYKALCQASGLWHMLLRTQRG